MGNVKISYNIWTDGGAKGNPGPAAIGVFITDEKGNCLLQFGKKIGKTTNNIAEWTAVYFALNWIKENLNFEANYCFFLDSLLVVNQLNNIYKVKDEKLKKYYLAVKNIEKEIIGKIVYQHIPREKNKVADKLLNDEFLDR